MLTRYPEYQNKMFRLNSFMQSLAAFILTVCVLLSPSSSELYRCVKLAGCHERSNSKNVTCLAYEPATCKGSHRCCTDCYITFARNKGIDGRKNNFHYIFEDTLIWVPKFAVCSCFAIFCLYIILLMLRALGNHLSHKYGNEDTPGRDILSQSEHGKIIQRSLPFVTGLLILLTILFTLSITISCICRTVLLWNELKKCQLMLILHISWCMVLCVTCLEYICSAFKTHHSNIIIKLYDKGLNVISLCFIIWWVLIVLYVILFVGNIWEIKLV